MNTHLSGGDWLTLICGGLFGGLFLLALINRIARWLFPPRQTAFFSHPKFRAERHVDQPFPAHVKNPAANFNRYKKEQALKGMILDLEFTQDADQGLLGNLYGMLADLQAGKDVTLPQVKIDPALSTMPAELALALLEAREKHKEFNVDVVFDATDHPLFKKAKK